MYYFLNTISTKFNLIVVYDIPKIAKNQALWLKNLKKVLKAVIYSMEYEKNTISSTETKLSCK